MAPPSFYVLDVGLYTQYKYAWYEVSNKAGYSDDWPLCPDCGGAVGGRYWLPPFEVTLKQPRHVGDFVTGAGGCDLLASERFLRLYSKAQLTGIEQILPITVVRMGTTTVAKALDPPSLYGLYLRHSRTRLKYDEMGVKWMSLPDPDYCRLCGPGGGGKGGCWISRERVVVDATTWCGEDIFYAMNGPGTILLSEKAANLFVEHDLLNAEVIACGDPKSKLSAP